MSVSRVSSPADPYATSPVNRTSQDTGRQDPREEPSARHGHHERGAPPPETPNEGTGRAHGSTSVGTILDVRA
jgi:hypothetical protein